MFRRMALFYLRSLFLFNLQSPWISTGLPDQIIGDTTLALCVFDGLIGDFSIHLQITAESPVTLEEIHYFPIFLFAKDFQVIWCWMLSWRYRKCVWNIIVFGALTGDEGRLLGTMRFFPFSSCLDRSLVEQTDIEKNQVMLFLNVYDLTPANNYLYWFGLGFYHSGIEGTIHYFSAG